MLIIAHFPLRTFRAGGFSYLSILFFTLPFSLRFYPNLIGKQLNEMKISSKTLIINVWAVETHLKLSQHIAVIN